MELQCLVRRVGLVMRGEVNPLRKINQNLGFFYGTTAPGGPGPPHCLGFTITFSPHSVWLLWTSDQPVAETSTWQHTTLTTDKHPHPDRIRSHNLSKRAAVDPHLRPRGHWYRHTSRMLMGSPSRIRNFSWLQANSRNFISSTPTDRRGSTK